MLCLQGLRDVLSMIYIHNGCLVIGGEMFDESDLKTMLKERVKVNPVSDVGL